jgi:hypothetical protein
LACAWALEPGEEDGVGSLGRVGALLNVGKVGTFRWLGAKLKLWHSMFLESGRSMATLDGVWRLLVRDHGAC